MSGTAFEVTATQGRAPGGVIVSIYPDRAGKHYRAGQLRLEYEDYAAMARMFGLNPVAQDKLPPRTDGGSLADEIASDAAEALKGISLQQAESSLVDDWNRHYSIGQPVLWQPVEIEGLDPQDVSTTRSRAFLLGGVATIWIVGFGTPVALSHVQPLPTATAQP